ncbi:MAG TPA: hypothetical protein VGO93_15750 [Candidatus Xenobia bacterium]
MAGSEWGAKRYRIAATAGGWGITSPDAVAVAMGSPVIPAGGEA